MSWFRALALDAIFVDEMLAIDVAGRSLLFVHLDDGLRAYDGRCPHRGFALGRGSLEEGVVRCAVHGWTFDARDGRGVNPRTACLASHPVRVEEGVVYVELEDEPRGTLDAPARGDR